jgi:hypothetical protein
MSAARNLVVVEGRAGWFDEVVMGFSFGLSGGGLALPCGEKSAATAVESAARQG